MILAQAVNPRSLYTGASRQIWEHSAEEGLAATARLQITGRTVT
jgi:hypothetical protein